MPSRGRAHALRVAGLVALLGACATKAPHSSDHGPMATAGAATSGGSGADPHAGHGAPLACLTTFIPAKCATSGCHDDQSRAYGMDLSTGESILAAWVDRNGLDNCKNQLVPRVVPGEPDASFVYRKITSQLACVGDVSQAMPPPPASPLSAAEVEIVRAWIAAGAPRDCDAASLAAGGASGGGASSGGTAPSVAGNDAGGANGSGAGGTGGSDAGGTSDMDDLFKCTATKPCIEQLLCHAVDGCSTEVWDCITHRPVPTGVPESSLPPGYRFHHPCPTETMEYCGCDGVTFTASATCPDRPYERPGNCSDGYNCDARDSVCADAAPSCAAGEAPKVVDGCYAGCVVGTDCRCEFNWECPEGWQCDRTQWRCTLAPPAGGT